MRIALVVLLLLALAAVGSTACVGHGGDEIAAVHRPAADSFDAALVARGAALASLGNCRGCHTVAAGRAFAGGRPLRTPFGTLYSTNITPHPDAGIGRWSEQAFVRAMREGVDRRGRHLYPAFPYDRFTLVSDEDNRALYAYLMTRTPVAARAPAHELPFPMDVRAFVGFWKALYFRERRFQPQPSRSALWNRGAYLAEGLGHCGSCHTPRNRLGAEERERHFAGGEVEGWHAYAIDASSRAPVPWDEEALAKYLHEGWHELHGVSRGPMALVTEALGSVPMEDLRALAHYTVTTMGEHPARRSRAPSVIANAARPKAAAGEGAQLYQDACHGCHDGSRPMPFGGLPMGLSIGVSGESPRNLVNVVLYGLPAAPGETSPVMPGFAGALSPGQVVALVEWLRAAFSNEPPWTEVERIVQDAIAAGPALGDHPVGATGVDPASITHAADPTQGGISEGGHGAS